MERYIAKPVNSRRFHGSIRLESLGNGLRDRCLSLLFEQLNQTQIFDDQRINLCCLRFEEICDGCLGVDRWNSHSELCNLIGIDRGITYANRSCLDFLNELF